MILQLGQKKGKNIISRLISMMMKINFSNKIEPFKLINKYNRNFKSMIN